MAAPLETVTVTASRPPGLQMGAGVNFLTTADPYFGGLVDFNFEAAQNSALRNTALANVTIDDVIEVADDGKDAIKRGEEALANAYTRRILDSFIPDATDAAEAALRQGASPQEIASQLAAREILDGQSFGATRAVEAVNAAISRLDTVVSTATRAMPEVVVSAGRVLGSTSLGLAGLIVEGMIRGGAALSDLAFRNALDRLNPPAGGSVPVLPGAPGDPVGLDDPRTQPEVNVRDRRPPPPAPIRDPFVPFIDVLPDAILGTPREPTTITPTADRIPNPLTDPLTLAPPVPVPGPLVTDLLGPWTFSDPLMPDLPAPRDVPTPRDVPAPREIPNPLTQPTPAGPFLPDTPNPTRNCDCSRPSKKKRKKKPREVCYRGTYIERLNGLTKFRKEKIPCQ